tara:strand:+ start:1327 stop:1611 length:285 start_codon:yes stop_codon:yes gene_type:complete
MAIKYIGTDAENKTFTNKTFADQIKLLKDRENDITVTAREILFKVATQTVNSDTLHELQLEQSTSTYTADSATKNYGIIIDCGEALSGDSTLPL